MYSKDQILGALVKVVYPGEKDIVSMGMVENISSTEEGIRFTLKTKRAKDPVINSLKHACVQALKEEFGPDTVILDIDVDSPQAAPQQKKSEAWDDCLYYQ